VELFSVELTVSAFTVRFEVVILLILILEVVMLELTVSILVTIVDPATVEYVSDLAFIVDAIKVELTV